MKVSGAHMREYRARWRANGAPPDDVPAWLIMRLGTKDEAESWVQLLGSDNDGRIGWRWTHNAAEAFQCARREDAEVLRDGLGLERFADVSIREHAWGARFRRGPGAALADARRRRGIERPAIRNPVVGSLRSRPPARPLVHWGALSRLAAPAPVRAGAGADRARPRPRRLTRRPCSARNGSSLAAEPGYIMQVRDGREGRPYFAHGGFSDQDRAKARASNSRAQAEHDARCLPAIRELRAKGWSWTRIARYLDLTVEPPGRRGGWTQGGWTHKAVQRIARRHGIE